MVFHRVKWITRRILARTLLRTPNLSILQRAKIQERQGPRRGEVWLPQARAASPRMMDTTQTERII